MLCPKPLQTTYLLYAMCSKRHVLALPNVFPAHSLAFLTHRQAILLGLFHLTTLHCPPPPPPDWRRREGIRKRAIPPSFPILRCMFLWLPLCICICLCVPDMCASVCICLICLCVPDICQICLHHSCAREREEEERGKEGTRRVRQH